MSTCKSAIIDPWIFQNSDRITIVVPEEPDGGWDPAFPSSNILDPQPKVKARTDASETTAWFTIDTQPARTIPTVGFQFDVFSLLYVEGINVTTKTVQGTTCRIRGADTLDGTWDHDTGPVDLWPFSGTISEFDERVPDFYEPPGVHVHIYLGAAFGTQATTRYLRFDFANDITIGDDFAIGGAACAKARIVPALFGSSTNTPIEESRDLWTWGDERIVKPGPKYDRKSWDVVMTEEQKASEIYMTLKRRGSSSPLIFVDELPPALPETNNEPWSTHQKTLYGTVSSVSPIIYSGLDEFRSTIELQEL